MSNSTTKLTLREKIVYALNKETDLPAVSATAARLLTLTQQKDVHLESVIDLIKLDPGITAKFLKVASSPAFSGSVITSLQEALLLLGMQEIQRISTTILLIDRLKHLRVKVNWDLFWFHSVLCARLTELLANAYRETTGKEYLAGLLHDIGKLFMEHYFPQEFELATLRAMMTKHGMFEAESRLLDINHAEVGAHLCERWHLDNEIVRAIRFHHVPNDPQNVDAENPSHQHFLALCVFLANRLANMFNANIQATENLDDIAFDQQPEWLLLKSQYVPRLTLKMNMEEEIKKTQEVLRSLIGASPSPEMPT
jgi:putative nucleotidyltransferase with HDIG domain